jgi:hypothetical protein
MTRHGRIGDQDLEGRMREMDPKLLGAGNSQQAPITIKVAFLVFMTARTMMYCSLPGYVLVLVAGGV